MTKVVVCAAARNKESGYIVCGPRHGDCINSIIKHGIGLPSETDKWECGFVDQENNFMSRQEAWVVADLAGQIRRPFGLEKDFKNQRPANVGDSGCLFSENLY